MSPQEAVAVKTFFFAIGLGLLVTVPGFALAWHIVSNENSLKNLAYVLVAGVLIFKMF